MCGLVSTVSYHCDFPISLSCCYTFLISSTWFYYTSIVCLISTIIFIHVWVFFPTAYFVMYLLSPMISQCINSLTSSLLNPSHLFWSLSSSLDFPQMPSHPWLLTHMSELGAQTPGEALAIGWSLWVWASQYRDLAELFLWGNPQVSLDASSWVGQSPQKSLFSFPGGKGWRWWCLPPSVCSMYNECHF